MKMNMTRQLAAAATFLAIIAFFIALIITPVYATETTTSATETEATTSAAETEATTSATETEATTSATETEATTSAAETEATTSATETEATTSATETEATTSATETEATTSATETEATTSAAETEATTSATETEATTSATETEATTSAAETEATTSAAETEATTSAAETEATTSATAAIITPGDNTEGGNHNLFSRIWEFVKKYSVQILYVFGYSVLFVINMIIKKSYKNSDDTTKQSLKVIGEKVSNTFDGQTSVVGVVNNLVDGFNSLNVNYGKMKESYDIYGTAENERNRIVGAVFATNAAILEILVTVYANSRNLPQGVKDLINLKYANCLKTMEDDSQLKAIVEAVQKNIGMQMGQIEVKDDEDADTIEE